MAEIRPCFFVEAVYVANAAEKRAPFRAEHLSRVEKLLKEGALLLAGAVEDMTASVLVFNVASEDAARAVVESDVYWKNGIWTDYTVSRLNRVVVPQQ
ncbi:MAG: YciI family protein [Acidimicrobiia bacterium]